MSTGLSDSASASYEQLQALAGRAFLAARAAANVAGDCISAGSSKLLEIAREREEELDRLDQQMNQGVSAAIAHVSEEQARNLLACLKVVLELERIGDLLLHFANRACAVSTRLEVNDVRDLTAMATLLEKMLEDASFAFFEHDLKRARAVLRADAEMDRLRNLLFVHHIENPEGGHRTESFQVVFMGQTLERAGDHSKNIAEEVVQVVTGRSVRHLLRASDKPVEQMWTEWMRSQQNLR